MRIADLKGINLAVYGLGKEGRSLLPAIAQRLPGQVLTVLNDTPLNEEETQWLKQFPQVKIDGATVEKLCQFAVIIKSPGISPYRPTLQQAKAQGVIFTSATRLWFAEHPQAKTICVTGTKGKSTTASLIAHLLRSAGVTTALGGNIGTPLFELPEERAPAFWVIELSSYQTSDFDGSPTVSALLNLFPEHTDWHGDSATYYRDKLNLLTCPQNQGIKILNWLDANTRRLVPALPNCRYFNDRLGFHLAENAVWQGNHCLLAASQVNLRGEHNLMNVCAALTAVEAVGVNPRLDSLRDFQSLPHRLAWLGEKHGIFYVDDSISTTPQSTQAAVRAFPDYFITVLVGGYERHLPWSETAQFFLDRPVQNIIALGESGPRIAQTIREALQTRDNPLFPQIHVVANLAQAVDLAQQITPRGGIVLLSPGSPSYGQFRNFQERGKAFYQLVFQETVEKII